MAKDHDLLQPLLDITGVGDRADPAALGRLWELVGDADAHRLDEYLEALAPPGEHDDALFLRAGEWSIDLRATAVRASVLSALVAGVLIPQGLGDFAVGFVTAILPAVIEIERIQLRAGDRRLLIDLSAKTDLGSEDELYAALPADVRSTVNRYDFADFIERLREAGFADGPEGGTIHLQAPPAGVSEHAFVSSIRCPAENDDMTGSNRRTVAPHNGRWAVEKPGTSRVSSIHDTQREAQDVARAALKRTGGGELVTLGTNGQIRSKDTIAPGHDPFPPRG